MQKRFQKIPKDSLFSVKMLFFEKDFLSKDFKISTNNVISANIGIFLCNQSFNF
jgi:hypothetical protein